MAAIHSEGNNTVALLGLAAAALIESGLVVLEVLYNSDIDKSYAGPRGVSTRYHHT